MKFEQIMAELKQKKYHPIYVLEGEEPYFIDQISDYIEDNVLTEGEKSFNLTVVYGKEADYLTLMDVVRRYPMMSQYQVVLLKEAQQMRDFDKLESYVNNPVGSTIFVISYKHKKLDKRKSLTKLLQKKSVFFTSDPLREEKIPQWILERVTAMKINIQPKAASLLAEYLGTDLSKIDNALEKLRLNLKEGEEITSELIEKFIGISKDYNVFELSNALMAKDVLKSNRIINYFAANPKAAPMPVLMATLYNTFSKIYLYHGNERMADRELASHMKVPPFYLRDYKTGGRNYPLDKTENIIHLLHQYDLKSKGVGNSSADHGALMKELVYKIIH